ncbi:MAG: peptidylprolyl isomerase [Candidatus Eisenbacteria bacterium]
MRRGSMLFLAVLLVSILSDCGGGGMISKGGDFELRVEDLRFEVSKLGPYSKYDETFESRMAIVNNIAARFYLAEEALRLGYDQDLEAVEKNAESGAVAEAYHAWKIDNAIMLPRIKTKPWQEKLDRKLHLKEMIFAVYPIAQDALKELRGGQSFETAASAMTGRDDVRVNDFGWVIWKELSREVANVVFRLDTGEVSDVMLGGDGYHIFYLAEAEPFGIGIELASVRSQRFAEAMEEEKLIEKEENEIAGIYDVRFPEKGLAAGLRSFQISFSGGRPPDSLISYVVATYNGGEVRVADLYNLYFTLPMQSRPYVGDYNALKEFAIETILPALEARAGYDLGLDRLRSVTWATRNAREEFLVGLMESYFRDQVEVTEEDLVEYYKERKDDIRTSGSYKVRRILVDSNDAARKALREINAGRDFSEVAAEISQDELSAKQGGQLPQINFGMVAHYDSVVSGLSLGEVSAPFTTTSGIEIIKLDELVEPVHLSFEEAREAIMGFVRNSDANELLADWVKQKKDEVGFWIDEDLLRRVTLPEPEYRKSTRQPGKGSGDLTAD